MLEALYLKDPDNFDALIPEIHKYLIVCSWNIQHLIPQEGLRNGLRGAEQWLEGKLTDEELNRLNWYAEADAFALDYAKTPKDFAEIQSMIDGIDELKGMSFEDAKDRLKRAAYFAQGAMIYSRMRNPYWKRMFGSEFLCPDLLRQHMTPNFEK